MARVNFYPPGSPTGARVLTYGPPQAGGIRVRISAIKQPKKLKCLIARWQVGGLDSRR